MISKTVCELLQIFILTLDMIKLCCFARVMHDLYNPVGLLYVENKTFHFKLQKLLSGKGSNFQIYHYDEKTYNLSIKKYFLPESLGPAPWEYNVSVSYWLYLYPRRIV